MEKLFAITSGKSETIHLLREPVAGLLNARGQKTKCGRTLTLGIGSGGYGADSLPAIMRGPFLCEGCKK